MSWQTELGEQIRKARKEAGFSQKRLAIHLSVTREQLSNYENGKSAPPVNVITEIASALQVEFTLGGCKITHPNQERLEALTPAQQLCFAYDTEHRFNNATLSIKPTKGAILIRAIVSRSRRA